MTRNPQAWLRAASVLGLLLALGHTLGAPWTPASEAPAAAVVDHMRAVHFVAMGSDASYWRFYVGFGASITCYLAALAVLMWQMAPLTRTAPALSRTLVLTLAAMYLAVGILAWVYFFVAPLVLSLGVAACLMASFLLTRSTASPRAV